MHSRGLTYAFVAVAAVAIGVLASGLVTRRGGTDVRVQSAPVTTTTTGATTTTTPNAPTTTTTTAAARTPASVVVLVANASGVTGAAAERSEALATAGYTMRTPVDAEEEAPVSRVLYTAGFAAEAAQIGSLLGIGTAAPMPLPLPVADPTDASVIVLLGND